MEVTIDKKTRMLTIKAKINEVADQTLSSTGKSFLGLRIAEKIVFPLDGETYRINLNIYRRNPNYEVR